MHNNARIPLAQGERQKRMQAQKRKTELAEQVQQMTLQLEVLTATRTPAADGQSSPQVGVGLVGGRGGCGWRGKEWGVGGATQQNPGGVSICDGGDGQDGARAHTLAEEVVCGLVGVGRGGG